MRRIYNWIEDAFIAVLARLLAVIYTDDEAEALDREIKPS